MALIGLDSAVAKLMRFLKYHATVSREIVARQRLAAIFAWQGQAHDCVISERRLRGLSEIHFQRVQLLYGFPAIATAISRMTPAIMTS